MKRQTPSSHRSQRQIRSIDDWEHRVWESNARRQEQLLKNKLRKKRKAKKRRRRILLVAALLALFVLLAWFLYRNLYLDAVEGASLLREEANESIRNTVRLTDTKNRMLTKAEKRADVEQLISYIKSVPSSAAPATQAEDFDQTLASLQKKAIASATDQEFRSAISEILEALGNANSRLLTAEEVLAYGKNAECGFLEKDSPYAKALLEDRVTERASRESKAASSSTASSQKKQATPSLTWEGKIAILHDLTFLDSDIPAHRDTIADFMSQAITSQALIFDLRGVDGFSQEYWTDLFLPYLSKGSVAASSTLFVPSAFSDYMDYLSLKESIDGFDLQDDRAQISMLLPQSVQDQLSDMDYQKKITFSSLASSLPSLTGEAILLVDENTGGGAETFADFCHSTGIAEVAGKKTEGSGWIPAPFLLPLQHSGYVVSLDTVVALSADGSQLQKEKGVTPTISLEGKDLLSSLILLLQ